LREDNADVRLADQASALGLLNAERRSSLERKRADIERGLAGLRAARLNPDGPTNALLAEAGEPELSSPATAFDLLRRPALTYAVVAAIARLPRYRADVEQQLEIAAKYDGYIRRQLADIDRMRGLEQAALPDELDFADVDGLSTEAGEKLARVRPRSLGQASRISGLTPAAISALAIHLKKTRAG